MANNPNNIDNLKPFQKGEDKRRNNSGQPPRLFTDKLIKYLKKKREITIPGIDATTGLATKIKVQKATIEILVNKLATEAANGNMQALKEILDRIEGKAMQPIQLTGKGGKEFNQPAQILILPPSEAGQFEIKEGE